MSGGSRGYAYFTIENELVGKMYDAELDDLMKDIAKLAHDVEWYDSSDYNKETYRKCVKEFKDKWFKQSREIRLKGYIDKAISNLKQQLLDMVGVEQQDALSELIDYGESSVGEIRAHRKKEKNAKP